MAIVCSPKKQKPQSALCGSPGGFQVETIFTPGEPPETKNKSRNNYLTSVRQLIEFISIFHEHSKGF